MVIAEQKKKENIIEYILYMWQVEELIRANGLDMQRINQNIIPSYKLPEEKLLQTKEWWGNLVEMMKLEGRETTGHLQININTVNDVNQLHQRLLKAPNEQKYQFHFNSIIPTLKDFDVKTGKKLKNDLEICLTAIYTTFILKIKGETISEGTQTAVEEISQFLKQLAIKYKLDQEDKLDLD